MAVAVTPNRKNSEPPPTPDDLNPDEEIVALETSAAITVSDVLRDVASLAMNCAAISGKNGLFSSRYDTSS